MKNKSFNIIKKGQLNSQTFVMEGDLSIKNAAAIRKTLLSHKTGGSVEFHLTNVEKLDITTVQLVYSFRNMLEKEGKKFSLTPELLPETEKLLKATGFENLLGTKNQN